MNCNRLGVFGGTFDPPHIGHLVLASEAAVQFSLSVVLWVLTSHPPHKQGRIITPAEIRLKLLESALADDSRFQISTVELDRPPPHYAVDTLMILKKQFPEKELVYLMGGDSLQELSTWHNPMKLIQLCNLIGVYQRPGFNVDLDQLENDLPGISRKVSWIHAPLIEISSSMIRKKVRSGEPYQYYLPAGVARLIAEYHLYQEGEELIIG